MEEPPLKRWRREQAEKKAALRLNHPNHKVITQGARKGQLVKLTSPERRKMRLQEMREVDEKRKQEVAEALRVSRENNGKLSTRLFAWGVNSEKHPTSSLGLFSPHFHDASLVVVPLFGLLYKLSFGIFGLLAVVCCVTGHQVYLEFRAKQAGPKS